MRWSTMFTFCAIAVSHCTNAAVIGSASVGAPPQPSASFAAPPRPSFSVAARDSDGCPPWPPNPSTDDVPQPSGFVAARDSDGCPTWPPNPSTDDVPEASGFVAERGKIPLPRPTPPIQPPMNVEQSTGYTYSQSDSATRDDERRDERFQSHRQEWDGFLERWWWNVQGISACGGLYVASWS
ncbi:hypothetical protein B0H13DRAFT_1872392 [Mycena leptocephala]|nr:hypothetical protein B0H13DRAFT_1872392 [Mycena leptocephala]